MKQNSKNYENTNIVYLVDVVVERRRRRGKNFSYYFFQDRGKNFSSSVKFEEQCVKEGATFFVQYVFLMSVFFQSCVRSFSEEPPGAGHGGHLLIPGRMQLCPKIQAKATYQKRK